MQKRGITLVALVVTIIVLLLLVGVTLGVVLGEDGVIAKAQDSKIESRYASIKDKVVIRETSLAVASLAGKTEDDHYVFVQSLRTQGLITDDELEAYDEETKTLYIGKLKDGSYKFEIVIPDDPENVGSGKNMILTIETEYDDQIIYLPISNATNLSINWDVKNSNHFEEQPDNSENPAHTYGQADRYEVQIKGISVPNTTFGSHVEIYGKAKSLNIEFEEGSAYKELVSVSKTSKTYITKIVGERERFLPAYYYIGNIVEIKSWGENGFTYFHPIGANLLNPLPTPSKKSFEKVINFDSTFNFCYNLTSIPEGLFSNCSNLTTCNNLFSNCFNLTSIPTGLFSNCPNLESVSSIFSGCSNLTGSFPENLFDNCPNITDFSFAFFNCEKLTGNAPTLWTRTNVEYFESCFRGCLDLSNYTSIDPAWK